MKTRIALTISLVVMMAFVTVVGVSADGSTSQTNTMIYNNLPVSGTLLGNRAGAYWYAEIDYPGDGNVVTINMSFYPADPVTRRGVGFNIYGPFNGELIGNGAYVEGIGGGFPKVQFTGNKPERLLLQVYNYIDGAQVNFTITGVGLPSAPVSVVAPLNGALVGSSAGAYERYMVTYNTADLATLVMTYSPTDSIISRGVGFRVYGPSGEVALNKDTSTLGTITATFTPVAGQQYLVQVENYIPGLGITYSFQSSANLVAVTTGN